MFGTVTQSPLGMGKVTIGLLLAIANGEEVSDADAGCAWYTAENMGDEDIAPNLYDGCTLVFRCMIPITRQTDGKPRAFHLFWRGSDAVLTSFP